MTSENTSDPNGDEFDERGRILALVMGESFASADKAIRSIADFDVSSDESRPFVEFIQWVNTNPRFISFWRSDADREAKHYSGFMGGIEACRAGYGASSYHLQRIREIETAVYAVLESFDLHKSVPKNTVTTIGSLRRCDYEYQAFVMAYRRALDGFAWGLSTYFKQQQSSFRKFVEHVPAYHPPSVAAAVSKVCQKHRDAFDFVMDKGRGVSVRDRMAHKEAVQAGTLNIWDFGHRLMGGGEGLGIRQFTDIIKLHEVLEERLRTLHTFVAEVLEALRLSVANHEASSEG